MSNLDADYYHPRFVSHSGGVASYHHDFQSSTQGVVQQQDNVKPFYENSGAIYLPRDLSKVIGQDGVKVDEGGLEFAGGASLVKYVDKFDILDSGKATLKQESKIYAHIEPNVPLFAHGINLRHQFKSYRTSLTLGADSLIVVSNKAFFGKRTIGPIDLPTLDPQPEIRYWPYKSLGFKGESWDLYPMNKYGFKSYYAFVININSVSDANRKNTFQGKPTAKDLEKAAFDSKFAESFGFEIFVPFLVKDEADKFLALLRSLIDRKTSVGGGVSK